MPLWLLLALAFLAGTFLGPKVRAGVTRLTHPPAPSPT